MDRLEAELDRLLAAVKSGDLAALSDLTLEVEAADAPTLARIRAKAERLALCLDAAAKGVREARWRVADIRAMGRDGESLVTYDGQGRRADLGAGRALAQRF